MSNESTARARAEAFRDAHELGTSPIGDVFELVYRSTGIDVSVIDASTAEHGLTMKDPRSDRICIAVARTENPMRQRSSVVHELGHVLAGDLDSDDSLSPGSRNNAEIQADTFARHLLLPIAALAGRTVGTPTYDDPLLSEVIQEFGVSPQVAAIQMREAGLIDASTCDAWMRLSTRHIAAINGWLDRYDQLAEDSNRARAPQGLLSRAVRAYRHGQLGLAELAAWYGRPEAELEAELGPPIEQTEPEDPWDATASIFDPPSPA